MTVRDQKEKLLKTSRGQIKKLTFAPQDKGFFSTQFVLTGDCLTTNSSLPPSLTSFDTLKSAQLFQGNKRSYLFTP